MDVDEARSPPDFKPNVEDVDEDEQEPDETMRLVPQELTNFWLTSLPAQVIDAWSEITEPNTELGKIRVYTLSSGQQVVRLYWTPHPNAEPIEYDLQMRETSAENYIVVTDKPKSNQPDERARTTEFKGAVEHVLECQARFDVDYEAHLKARHDAAQPQGGIKFMEDMGVSMSEIKTAISGRGVKAAPGTGIGKPQKQAKQPFERMARMAKNDLLDALFLHFRQKAFWSIKELRQKVQQPETYLREVLNEIAVLERSGPNMGNYRLTDNYRAENGGEDEEDDDDLVEMKVDNSQQYSKLYKMEPTAPVAFDYGAPDSDGDDEDDEDDEDEEMVEVLH